MYAQVCVQVHTHTPIHRYMHSCVGDEGRRWWVQSGSGLSVLMFLLRFGTNTIRWRFVYEIVFVGGCFTAAATDEIYSYKRKGKFETQVSSASAAYIHITRYFVRTHTHTHALTQYTYLSMHQYVFGGVVYRCCRFYTT